MPDLTVEFNTITPDAATHAYLQSAIDNGDRVEATANVRVGVTDHRVSERITAWPDAKKTLHAKMSQTVDVPDGSSVEVTFKLEISRTVGTEAVAAEIVQPIPAPYYTQPDRSSTTDDGTSKYDLGWRITNTDNPDIVEKNSCAMRAEDAPRSCMATVVQPTNCWQYQPVHTDTLVVDRSEYTAPVATFLNWKHGNNVSHTNIPPRPHRCRNRSAVTAIVIHETASWRSDDATRDVRAHFVVHTDGRVVQLYDAVQLVWHANNRNGISVGIEFVNIVHIDLEPADDHDHFTPPNHARNREQRDLIPGMDMWAMAPAHRRYVVPPVVQLEAGYQLVRHLMHHLSVPSTWLSLDHPEADHLFLMWRWEAQYNQAGAAGNRAGIYSHLNIAGANVHTDGGFITLYTWLRHVHNQAPAAARTNAMDLVENHMVRVNQRKFVDTRGV